MNDYVLLGDLHIGVKNDDPWMESNIIETLQWFCQECKTRNVSKCIQLGDFFDVRRGLTQRTLQFVREEIIPMFQETFETTYVIVGNHDLHMREIITPNSSREVFDGVDGFEVIETPTTITIGENTIDLIPWVCKSNKQDVSKFIANSNSDVCCGHFEINGALFYKGAVATGCEDPDFLEKYKIVYSGHFHTISSIGNVQYTGTPYTITLGDANDVRGIWFHKSESNENTFVPNPVTYHRRIYFDADTWKDSTDSNLDAYKNKVVKIVIEKALSDNKKVSIDQVLDDLERVCHELKHEYKEEMQLDQTLEVDESSVVSTIAFIEEQVELLDEPDDVRKRILKIFNGLLSEVE